MIIDLQFYKEAFMRCPGCGENIDGLEETCREEFNMAYGEHFDNLEAERRKQAFRFGLMTGIGVDMSVLCLAIWLSG